MRKTAFLPGLHVRSWFLAAPRSKARTSYLAALVEVLKRGGAIEYTMRLFAVKVGSPKLPGYASHKKFVPETSMREPELLS
jgi:hypothetical protein